MYHYLAYISQYIYIETIPQKSINQYETHKGQKIEIISEQHSFDQAQ